MKFIIFICVLLLSACSISVVDMTPEPTNQEFDLTDSEGDGIIKARDDCPDSNKGEKVDNNGCGSNTVHTIKHRLDVNFDTNSSVVKSEYLPQIKELANFMTEFPQVSVSIEGHTSILGSDTHNKKLSNNRARSIKNILIQRFDIAGDRITTVGYGFEKLLFEGDDEYSHEKNRRIVAEISSDKSLTDMKWTIYSVDSEIE
ncbi:MAG TPA: OmpA family protein [Colwellia sp.]|nr:OmpA family protein [Colwellia sp.]|tara:strand:- start:1916 stop:2518 length:603 start_codon:yes stop_codon:yes gene_type:complete